MTTPFCVEDRVYYLPAWAYDASGPHALIAIGEDSDGEPAAMLEGWVGWVPLVDLQHEENVNQVLIDKLETILKG